ncbi:MAG TPA: gamma-glutamyl-gamma-aminobutyrate hydrolase family protein, partial [Candidatus Sulfotelmatobacter sp.]|nr:gamma-glutamyl-gamma-aminobutyrate hydrolase family protein [Candidatus Sulfotelmatobacter sp.]
NNYKEPEKAKQALHNIALCTGQQPEMLDHNATRLHEAVLQKDPDVVILTGSNFMLSKPDTGMVFQAQMDLVRKTDLPILGICFGHQLIGAAYGSQVVDLGHNVRAFKAVKLLGSDPLLDGLPSLIRVSESHRQAIASVPEGFRHLAESVTSQVEAISHKSRPIYGVQFHPERADEKHPHGRIILRNFLKLAAKL